MYQNKPARALPELHLGAYSFPISGLHQSQLHLGGGLTGKGTENREMEGGRLGRGQCRERRKGKFICFFTIHVNLTLLSYHIVSYRVDEILSIAQP